MWGLIQNNDININNIFTLWPRNTLAHYVTTMGKRKGLGAAGLRNLGQYAMRGLKRRRLSKDDDKENMVSTP